MLKKRNKGKVEREEQTGKQPKTEKRSEKSARGQSEKRGEDVFLAGFDKYNRCMHITLQTRCSKAMWGSL